MNFSGTERLSHVSTKPMHVGTTKGDTPKPSMAPATNQPTTRDRPTRLHISRHQSTLSSPRPAEPGIMNTTRVDRPLDSQGVAGCSRSSYSCQTSLNLTRSRGPGFLNSSKPGSRPHSSKPNRLTSRGAPPTNLKTHKTTR